MTNDTEDVFPALCRAVHSDSALQARLFALTDTKEFIAVVHQLSQASGHVLTEDEVLQAMRAGRKVWSDRKLP